MSDFVRTEYCIKGEKEALDKLYGFMKEHATGEDLECRFTSLYTALGEESYVPDSDDDFYETDDDRNYALEQKRTEDAVEFVTETVWDDCICKFSNVLYGHFPGIRILWNEQDCGEDRDFCTNDMKYERFRGNWYFLCEKIVKEQYIEEEYFETLEDVLKYADEFFGVRLDHSAYDGERDIDELNEQLRSDLENLGMPYVWAELWRVRR